MATQKSNATFYNTKHLLPATGYYNQLMREIDDAYWIGNGDDVEHLEAKQQTSNAITLTRVTYGTQHSKAIATFRGSKRILGGPNLVYQVCQERVRLSSR